MRLQHESTRRQVRLRRERGDGARLGGGGKWGPAWARTSATAESTGDPGVAPARAPVSVAVHIPGAAPGRAWTSVQPSARGRVGVSSDLGTNRGLNRDSAQVLAASAQVPGAVPAWVRAWTRGLRWGRRWGRSRSSRQGVLRGALGLGGTAKYLGVYGIFEAASAGSELACACSRVAGWGDAGWGRAARLGVGCGVVEGVPAWADPDSPTRPGDLALPSSGLRLFRTHSARFGCTGRRLRSRLGTGHHAQKPRTRTGARLSLPAELR